MLVPTVIERSNNAERAFDIYSQLHKERVIFLHEDVNANTAGIIIAQLLSLEREDPNKDIRIYIDSPGGSVDAGWGIVDTMNSIKCDVETICVGMAASMGAVLLAAGTKGKRYCTEHSRVMIHQPMGGMPSGSQASDMKIATEQILETRAEINEFLAEMTGQPLDVIARDTERDFYMRSQKALEYGIIDGIIKGQEIIRK